MKNLILIVILAAIFVLPTGVINAGLYYNFDIYSDNGNYSDSPDLWVYMEVFDLGYDKAGFEIHNQSSVSSSAIANIYFEQNKILTGYDIVNSTGVDFSAGSHPSKLGGDIEPDFSIGDSISARPPSPHNGINSGEWVGLDYHIEQNASYSDVINAINSGELRVGIKIKSLPDGSSEWAVNSKASSTSLVPEPATLMLLAFGCAAVLTAGKKSITYG